MSELSENKEVKDKKAKLSGFQFTSPYISHFEFNLNENYQSDSEEVSLPITYNVNKKSAGALQQYVELTMNIGNENSPFTFKAVIGANFRWNPGLDNETVKNLLDKNAVSLLIGYLRPIISQFTVQAGVAPLNLPFIDLSKDE